MALFNKIYTDVIASFTPDDNRIKSVLNFLIVNLKNTQPQSNDIPDEVVVIELKKIIVNLKNDKKVNNLNLIKTLYNKYLQNYITKDDIILYLDMREPASNVKQIINQVDSFFNNCKLDKTLLHNTVAVYCNNK